jgi:hypothetical protein
MGIHLVVVRPFDGSARGDIITDPARISTILSSQHAYLVVRVASSAPGGR